MALHRNDVITAALDLLDEVGLERLTTRALTERLGVAPGALYWHVRSKQELLAAMAATVAAPAFTTPGTDGGAGTEAETAAKAGSWAEHTEAFAHRLRRALLARRDGARLVSGHLVPGPATLRSVEGGLVLMSAQGLTPAQAAVLGHAVTSYVIGCVLQEQREHAPTRGTAGPDPTHYPLLLQWQAEHPGPDATFTAGLTLLTTGLAAQLA